jgi:hypothetical protein
VSTPQWKKQARQQEHRKAKEKREWEKKYGLTTRAKKVKTEFVPYSPPKVIVRETPNYPSLSNSIPVGHATKPERKVYTGDLIVGIATMHKSNLVPVMRGTSQAEDIAKMRRG